MTVLAQLRRATHERHQHLESRLAITRVVAGHKSAGAQVADKGEAWQAWARYLKVLQGWLTKYNRAVWDRPWPAYLQPAQRLAKCGWLARDLERLGLAADPGGEPDLEAQLEPEAAISGMSREDHKENPRLLGWAYVIEGSMLGGRSLRRSARNALGFVPCFLEGYGVDTGPMWRSLVSELERVGRIAPTNADEMAAAACDAFDDITTWMRHHGVAD